MKDELIELYHNRNILKSLIVKNLIGRYSNSVIGFSWHFVMPLTMLAVYYVVFTEIRITPIPHFLVYLACGVFPFSFIISNLSAGAGCMVNNAPLIKKIYFPREIIVLSHVISSFIILLINYSIVIVIMIVLGHSFQLSLVMLPFLLILTFMFTLGFVLLFSALTVYVRDVQYFLSSISIIFYFITPTFFDINSTSGVLSNILWFNPVTYFIEFFHNIVYYGVIPDLYIVVITFILAITSFIIGVSIFGRLKRGFAERL